MGYFASSSLLYRNAYLQAASQFQSNNPSLALIQKCLFQFQQDGQECQIGIYIAGEQDIDLGIILRMGNENEPYHVFFFLSAPFAKFSQESDGQFVFLHFVP